MRISTFEDFGAKNSAPVFAAFRQGAARSGMSCASHDITADVAVIWSVVWAGRMKQNQRVWQTFRDSGRPVIVLEVGMLQRGMTWKMGINGTGRDAVWCEPHDTTRPQQLNLRLRPWRQSGSFVLITTQRRDSEQWQGMHHTDQWLADTVVQLRRHTDRPIRVRTHPRQRASVPLGCEFVRPMPMIGTYDSFDLAHSLNDAWAVVNHNSGPGSQAIIEGCPAFVDQSSLAAPVGNLDLAHIETPGMPNRDQWLIDISHTEWTLPEISSGPAVDKLLTRIKSL
jgi:hypothetical protein